MEYNKKNIVTLYKSFFMKINLCVILLITVFFSNCNIVNPTETIPTYIKIDSVSLISTQSAIHGSVSHKIKDVWVFYERELLGAFELPAKIPVLANNKGQLQIIAGVWDNGLSGTRARYPFYTVDTFSIDPQPGKTIQHTPVFNYRTADVPPIKYFVESFEQGNSFKARNGKTTFVKTDISGEVYEGNWSSKVELNDTLTDFEGITTQEFVIPPGSDAYVELDYKSDTPFEVYLELNYQGNVFTLFVIGLNSKKEWTKVYLNLSGYAVTYQNAKCKVILRGLRDANIPISKTLIDNFKFIFFL